MKRRSLESRLCFLIAGLLFALLFAIGHVQMTEQRSTLIEDKIDKYHSLSNALALAYMPLVEGNGESFYREMTSRMMRADADISYIIIADSDKRTLFADTREFAPRQYDSLIGRETGRLLSLVRRLSSPDAQEFKKITIPTLVKPGERGTVTVGFGSRSIDRATEELQTRLLFTFAVAFLIGIIGAISLARTVVTPIRKLITAAREVTSGNLDTRVPVSLDDEIGELAHAFNRMVSALKESRDKLIERANTDSLTDVYNHRYFQERLSSELSRAVRYQRPLSVVMLDIDHFKTLNDTHGHPIGDSVLQQVARLLVAYTRDIDVVARYGGEEFALILPETQIGEAVVLAERLRLMIQRHCFVGKDGESIPVTVSLGAAQYPTHSSEREGLIMAADIAMYQAKSLGRNRAVAYSNDTAVENQPDPYKLYLLLHAKDISTIEAMAAAVDAKGRRDQGYSRTVMTHCLAIGRELGLSEKELDDIRIASLLHDIGKLGIPDEVLNKTEPLTSEEQRIVKSHPALGYAIVQKSPHLKSMLPGILHHHERWDGNGYPNCLKGEEIPLIARMIAVVDAYHAMMTKRPHSTAMLPEDAITELRQGGGAQFDPNIVEVFLRILDREQEANRTPYKAA